MMNLHVVFGDGKAEIVVNFLPASPFHCDHEVKTRLQRSPNGHNLDVAVGTLPASRSERCIPCPAP